MQNQTQRDLGMGQLGLGYTQAQNAYNLGLVLMRAGRPDARQWFEQALERDPAFRPARERLAELPR